MKNTRSNNRRDFIKKLGLGTAVISGLGISKAAGNPLPPGTNDYAHFFSKNDTVLLQGDSITDAGRDKKKQLYNDADSLGRGYALLLASELLASMPDKNLKIYNRGISGNKVFQLADRWDADCLDLKPNVLSILIGVNDYWHMRNGKYEGTPEIYETDYKKLLDRTLKALTDVKLIICEPFVLANTKAVDDSWLEEFSKYQAIASKIAKEYEATWVPFQAAFSNAVKEANEEYWTRDGVHPSVAGAQLMTDTWLKTISKKSRMLQPDNIPHRISPDAI